MRYQEFKAGCGAGAILNALLALGEHQFQEVVHALAEGTSDGIAPASIRNCLDELGYGTAELKFAASPPALRALRRSVRKCAPVIVCVDDWEHWVTVIGALGERFLVADPADNELVVSLSTAQFLKRWLKSGKRKAPYYGISVYRRLMS